MDQSAEEEACPICETLEELDKECERCHCKHCWECVSQLTVGEEYYDSFDDAPWMCLNCLVLEAKENLAFCEEELQEALARKMSKQLTITGN